MTTLIVSTVRGWQFVGELGMLEADVMELKRARAVRRWGAGDRGLGVLRDGPTSETILDVFGSLLLNPRHVEHYFQCDEGAWKEPLALDEEPLSSNNSNTIVISTARGWQFVAHVEDDNEESLVLRDTKCLRRWGTQGVGLGALRLGPRPETALDDFGTLTVKPWNVEHRFYCQDTPWAAKLAEKA